MECFDIATLPIVYTVCYIYIQCHSMVVILLLFNIYLFFKKRGRWFGGTNVELLTFYSIKEQAHMVHQHIDVLKERKV